MEPKEFKKLQKTWYKKLKKSGFNDIEYDEFYIEGMASAGSVRNYKIYNSESSEAFLNTKSTTASESKASYYRLVGHFLWEHKFKYKEDKMVWELHAEGHTVRDISKMLKKKRIKTMSPSKVYVIIKQHRELMFNKYKE